MKFNTVKSKVILLLSILTLLGTIFCIVSCDNFLSQNYGKTTININLDLSKLIKNSRNDDTQITGYVLKLFVYDAKNYQEGDKEIENLPLLTQTSNKVDISGTVKANLELSIASTVIFVGKLFTLNENNIESDKPLYAGKTDVYKVLPYNNNVHLVLTKTHEHTFATEWSTSLTHHWKGTTCGHNDVMAEFTEHTFSAWRTTKEATEEEAGSKERSCDVCNYKETTEIAQLAHTHTFSSDWQIYDPYHWRGATCEHSSEVTDFGEHSFPDELIRDETGHWKICICGKISEFARHSGEWTVTEQATETDTGRRYRNCEICDYYEDEIIGTILEGFAFIPKGSFQMGSTAGGTDEKPVHEVTLTKDFYMSKYEVTQAEYEQYCTYGSDTTSEKPSDTYGEGENYPAYYVSWYDALVYCNKRSMAEELTPCYSISNSTNPNDWGIVPKSSSITWNAVVCDWEADGYRLPTEAEWEYAARAGDNTVDTLTYSGTSDVNKLGEYAYVWDYSNSDSTTHEVGTRIANAFGLYDMSGNVWEWCWNWHTSSYDTTTEGKSDPTGDLSGIGRVSRGGGWNNSAYNASVSKRTYDYPSIRSNNLGFRLVRASSK